MMLSHLQAGVRWGCMYVAAMGWEAVYYVGACRDGGVMCDWLSHCPNCPMGTDCR